MPRKTLEIVVEGKDLASAQIRTAGDAIGKLGTKSAETKTALQKLADAGIQKIGFMAADLARQIPQMIGQLYDLGAQSKAVTTRFERFAGGAQQAQEYLDAFNESTDRTVPKMEGMAAASKMLQMGLVENAEEMGTMAAVAVRLGNQTMTAGQRMADFSALLANRSIPRLDNFGISSSKVREKVALLKKEGYGLDEAFKLAVLEEGRKSLEKLGDTTDLAATKMAQYKKTMADTKVELAEYTVEQITAADGAGGLAQWLSKFPGYLRRLSEETKTGASHYRAYNAQLEEMTDKKARLAGLGKGWQRDEENIRRAIEETRITMVETTRVVYDSTHIVADYEFALGDLTATVRDTGGALTFYEEKLLEAKRQMAEAADARAFRVELQKQEKALFDVSLQFTDFFRNQEEQAERFADTREGIEEKFEERVADLAKRGQSRRISIDAEAEEKKLKTLEENLAIALQQRDEFDDRTRESTRMTKDSQIRTMEEQVAEQETLLDNYHNNRLWTTGENVNALVAEAGRERDESLTILEEQMAAQEEMQRQSLGRMLLQSFEAWASQKGIAADKMLEMRVAISEEYGLIDERAADATRYQLGKWEEWAAGLGLSTAQVAQGFDDLQSKIDRYHQNLLALPKEIDIRIRTIHETIGEFSPGAHVPTIAAQHGFSGVVGPGFGGARNFLAGEGGRPERVTVQPLSSTVGSNNTYNIYDKQAMALLVDRERQEQRNALGRLM